MSITVVARIKAKQGSEQQIEQAARAMVAKVRGEAGTETYVLHRSAQDPTVFLFYESYKDQDAFAAHGNSPHMAEFLKALRGNLDGHPQIDTLSVLEKK
jgi:quinol monooxygenase YgiN